MIVARPSGTVAGRTPVVPLEVEKGVDLNFDLRWWADESRVTPVMIESADAQIRTVEGSLIVDIQPNVAGNVVMVRVPASVTSSIAQRAPGVWDLEVVAAVSGERKKLAKGPVRFFEEVSQ